MPQHGAVFQSLPAHLSLAPAKQSGLYVALSRPIPRMTISKESELKQLENEHKRAAWRKTHPPRETRIGNEEIDREV
jgi:hypothetical protein